MKNLAAVTFAAMLVMAFAPAPRYTDVSCRATASSTNIAQFAEVAIPFNGETYDTDSIHDNTTNNTRYLIPADGKYSFVCNISMNPVLGGGTVFLFAKKNGTTYLEKIEHPENPGLALAMGVNGENLFVAGDYIEFTMLVIAGGQIYVSATAVLRKVD